MLFSPLHFIAAQILYSDPKVEILILDKNAGASKSDSKITNDEHRLHARYYVLTDCFCPDARCVDASFMHPWMRPWMNLLG
jgi:hypothetical protein